MRIVSRSWSAWRLLAVARSPCGRARSPAAIPPEPHVPAPAAIAAPEDGRGPGARADSDVAARGLRARIGARGSHAGHRVSGDGGRIYDVQAVLARTYAVSHLGRHRAEGFDLCDGTHCQLYAPERVATSRFAPDRPRRRPPNGRADRRLLAAARRGAVSRRLWRLHGRRRDGLGTARCPICCPRRTTCRWPRIEPGQLTITADELRSALNADARTRVGRTLGRLDVKDRDVSGRAAEVSRSTGDRDLLMRGEDFRAVLNQKLGDRAMQSTRFTVDAVRAARTFSRDRDSATASDSASWARPPGPGAATRWRRFSRRTSTARAAEPERPRQLRSAPGSPSSSRERRNESC